MGCAAIIRKIPSKNEPRNKRFIILRNFRHDSKDKGLFCIQEESSYLEQSYIQYYKKCRNSPRKTDVIFKHPNLKKSRINRN